MASNSELEEASENNKNGDLLPDSAIRKKPSLTVMRRKLVKFANARLSVASEHSAITIDISQSRDTDVCRIEDSPFYVFKSCGRGHFEVVERLLIEDPGRVNAPDNKGWTCLHHAAARGRIKIIELLLDREADLDAQDQQGNTPLHIACEKGRVESVSELLLHGANGNILNHKFQAPTHVATAQNKPDIIDELAKFPDLVDVNTRGWHGATALHDSAVLDHPECAQALIKGGCKLCMPCENGFYPILLAAKHASIRTLEVLLKTGESLGYAPERMLNFVDNERNSALHAAVNSGDLRSVAVCLEHGARIDAKQENQATAFHLACSQGTLSIVQLMYESHAKRFPEDAMEVLFMKDVQDMTPLHKAAMFDHPEVVKYLIDMGSELDDLDIERRSPLLLAAVRGGVQSLNVLLSHGASVSVRDSSKRNVLHFMVAYGGSLGEELKNISATEEGRKLLNQKDATGCTPMHLASKQGSLRLLDSLLTLGAMVNPKDNEDQSPLHFAARHGRINTVRRLLRSEQGPNIINGCDGAGMTALHLASMNGHFKVVQQLLYKGALLHKDFNGSTPLHLASEAGYTQTMRLLLSFHGNLLDQTDKKGNSALHYAAQANKASPIRLLLSANAVYDLNKEKWTPMDICIEQKFSESATVMVEHDRWHEILYRPSSIFISPPRGLIQHLPEVYKIILNRCHTRANIDSCSRDYWEKYKFTYLQVHYSNYKDIQKRYKEELQNWTLRPLLALNVMVDFGRVDLLSHPVCLTYLRMKWRAYGCYIYSLNLFFYMFFLLCYTFLFGTFQPYIHACSNTFNLSEAVAMDRQRGNFIGDLFSWRGWRCYACFFIFFYMIINIVKEFLQMYQQRGNYFKDIVNYTEWALYITAVALVGRMLVNPFGCVTAFQWQLGAVSIFFAWLNLLLYMSCTQKIGIYIVMFLQILNTVIRVILVFSILFIAFGLTFRALLFNTERGELAGPFLSVMHTVLMMMGDWHFMVKYSRRYDSDELLFPALNFFFLLLFIILMPILFINMLIGLAVGDIEMVLKNAQLKRIAMQVEYHTELEERLPIWFLLRVDRTEVTVYPNRCYCIRSSGRAQMITRCIKKIFGIDDSLCSDKEEEGKATQVESEPPDVANDAVLYEMSKIKKRIKDSQAQLDKVNELLRLIVQKMEINAEADEYDEGVVRKNTFTMAAAGGILNEEPTTIRRHKRSEQRPERKIGVFVLQKSKSLSYS